MNILVIGGCGYIGTVLCEKLFNQGYKVTILDSQIFGNFLDKKKFNFIKKDIIEIQSIKLTNYNTIIHLANIANDPSVELNPSISWEVNVLGTYLLVNKAIKDGVKKIIFSSSGSVYGVRKERKVDENISPIPLSTYNKTKIIAERVLLSYSDKIKINCIRPATVCGYSKKMRLDLTVNSLVFQALKYKKIKVFGGAQIRPNIHIQDLTDIFIFFLKNNIPSGYFNAGFENLTVMQIAEKVKSKINCKIDIKKIIDLRSYRLESSKLQRLGFKRKFTVDHAIDELISYNQSKQLNNDLRFHSINWLKKIGLK